MNRRNWLSALLAVMMVISMLTCIVLPAAAEEVDLDSMKSVAEIGAAEDGAQNYKITSVDDLIYAASNAGFWDANDTLYLASALDITAYNETAETKFKDLFVGFSTLNADLNGLGNTIIGYADTHSMITSLNGNVSNLNFEGANLTLTNLEGAILVKRVGTDATVVMDNIHVRNSTVTQSGNQRSAAIFALQNGGSGATVTIKNSSVINTTVSNTYNQNNTVAIVPGTGLFAGRIDHTNTFYLTNCVAYNSTVSGTYTYGNNNGAGILVGDLKRQSSGTAVTGNFENVAAIDCKFVNYGSNGTNAHDSTSIIASYGKNASYTFINANHIYAVGNMMSAEANVTTATVAMPDLFAVAANSAATQSVTNCVTDAAVVNVVEDGAASIVNENNLNGFNANAALALMNQNTDFDWTLDTNGVPTPAADAVPYAVTFKLLEETVIVGTDPATGLPVIDETTKAVVDAESWRVESTGEGVADVWTTAVTADTVYIPDFSLTYVCNEDGTHDVSCSEGDCEHAATGVACTVIDVDNKDVPATYYSLRVEGYACEVCLGEWTEKIEGSSPAPFSVTVDQELYMAGDTVTVTVDTVDDAGITSYDATVTYDTAKLTYEGAEGTIELTDLTDSTTLTFTVATEAAGVKAPVTVTVSNVNEGALAPMTPSVTANAIIGGKVSVKEVETNDVATEFTISTPEELIFAAQKWASFAEGDTLYLANDIDINDYVYDTATYTSAQEAFAKTYVPFGTNQTVAASLKADFDGQGYTIKNFAYYQGTRADNVSGIFGYVSGDIKNLNIVNPVIQSNYPGVLSGLTGPAQNNTLTVSNVHISGAQVISTVNSGIGGIFFGYNHAKTRTIIIENSSAVDCTLSHGEGLKSNGLGIITGSIGDAGAVTVKNCVFKDITVNSDTTNAERDGGILVGHFYPKVSGGTTFNVDNVAVVNYTRNETSTCSPAIIAGSRNDTNALTINVNDLYVSNAAVNGEAPAVLLSGNKADAVIENPVYEVGSYPIDVALAKMNANTTNDWAAENGVPVYVGSDVTIYIVTFKLNDETVQLGTDAATGKIVADDATKALIEEETWKVEGAESSWTVNWDEVYTENTTYVLDYTLEYVSNNDGTHNVVCSEGDCEHVVTGVTCTAVPKSENDVAAGYYTPAEIGYTCEVCEGNWSVADNSSVSPAPFSVTFDKDSPYVAGETAKVTIALNEDAGILGYDATVTYDAAKLTYVGVDADWCSVGVNDGTLTLNVLSQNGTPGAVSITLEFTIAEDALAAELPIEVALGTVLGVNAEGLTVEVTPRTTTVEAVAAMKVPVGQVENFADATAFTISTVDELIWAAANISKFTEGDTLYIISDLNITEYNASASATFASQFVGFNLSAGVNLDGENHNIIGYNSTTSFITLLPGNEIRNITFKSADIPTPDGNYGMILGVNVLTGGGTSIVENVHVIDSKMSAVKNNAFFMGFQNGKEGNLTFENCSVINCTVDAAAAGSEVQGNGLFVGEYKGWPGYTLSFKDIVVANSRLLSNNIANRGGGLLIADLNEYDYTLNFENILMANNLVQNDDADRSAVLTTFYAGTGRTFNVKNVYSVNNLRGTDVSDTAALVPISHMIWDNNDPAAVNTTDAVMADTEMLLNEGSETTVEEITALSTYTALAMYNANTTADWTLADGTPVQAAEEQSAYFVTFNLLNGKIILATDANGVLVADDTVKTLIGYENWLNTAGEAVTIDWDAVYTADTTYNAAEHVGTHIETKEDDKENHYVVCDNAGCTVEGHTYAVPCTDENPDHVDPTYFVLGKNVYVCEVCGVNTWETEDEASAANAPTVLDVVFNADSYTTDETVAATLNVVLAADIAAMTATVTFDAEKLAYVSASGPASAMITVAPAMDEATGTAIPGLLNVTINSVDGMALTEGAFTLTFDVITDEAGEASISGEVAEVVLGDLTYTAPLNVSGGTDTVALTAAVHEGNHIETKPEDTKNHYVVCDVEGCTNETHNYAVPCTDATPDHVVATYFELAKNVYVCEVCGVNTWTEVVEGSAESITAPVEITFDAAEYKTADTIVLNLTAKADANVEGFTVVLETSNLNMTASADNTAGGVDENGNLIISVSGTSATVSFAAAAAGEVSVTATVKDCTVNGETVEALNTVAGTATANVTAEVVEYPTDKPYMAVSEENVNLGVLHTNGLETTRVYWGYIGTEYMECTTWNAFYSAVSATDTYTADFAPINGETYAMTKPGYYTFVVRYTDAAGATKEAYYTLQVAGSIDENYGRPYLEASEDGKVAWLNKNGMKVRKLYWGYIGEENYKYVNWYEFLERIGDTYLPDYDVKDNEGYIMNKPGYYRFLLNYEKDGQWVDYICTIYTGTPAEAPSISNEALSNVAVLTDNYDYTAKVYYGYIGTENTKYKDFNGFIADTGDTFTSCFGDNHGQTYNLDQAGYWRFVINYNVNGATKDAIYTVEVKEEDLALGIPKIAVDGNIAALNYNGTKVNKMYVGYMGTEEVTITNWNDFVAKRLNNTSHFGPKDGYTVTLSDAGYYTFVVNYTLGDVTKDAYITVYVEG